MCFFGWIPDRSERFLDKFFKNEPVWKMEPTPQWQKCPICSGTGIGTIEATGFAGGKCPTCNGERIINTITGKPPEQEIPPTNK